MGEGRREGGSGGVAACVHACMRARDLGDTSEATWLELLSHIICRREEKNKVGGERDSGGRVEIHRSSERERLCGLMTQRRWPCI